jgi:thioesterase domain-containing protein
MPDPLVPLRLSGSRIPLYCIHSASGSAYSYAPLLPLLDDDRPVYGVEAPGFEDDDDKPLTTVAELSDVYLRAIDDERPGEPFCLLGWSFGGVIGFDMAQRTHAAGRSVPMLITVDTPVPAPAPVPDQRPILRRFAADLTGAAPLSDQHELDEAMTGRPADEPIEETFAALADAGLIPEELDTETLACRYAVFHANIVALFNYQPAGGYPGPMITIRASETTPDLDHMDWSGLSAGVTTVTVPGDHYSIWQDTSLVTLADIVSTALRGI